MKIEREKLAAALRVAKLVAEKRGNMPILGCVLLDGGTQSVAATDLETSIIVPLEMKDVIKAEPAPLVPIDNDMLEGLSIAQLEQIATDYGISKPKSKKPTEKAWIKAIMDASEKSAAKEAKKAETGNIERYCLPAEQLLKIVSSINDKEVEIKPSYVVSPEMFSGGNYVSIGNNFRNMATLPADEFPVIVAPEFKKATVECSVQGLLSVMKATTDEETGFKLSVVHFDVKRQEMVATDGHRLHVMPATVSDPSDSSGDELESEGFNVGRSFLRAVIKVAKSTDKITLELEGGKEGTGILSKVGDITFIGRNPGTKFPDYPSFVKEGKNKLVVTREAVEVALSQALVLSNQTIRAAKMTFNGAIEIQMINPDCGEYINTSVPVVKGMKGDAIEMGINPQYFLDAIRTGDKKDEITIGVTAHDAPVSFKHHDFFAVVMPMRF